MTKLLQEAFTLVSTQLNQRDQDRLAHLMIENIDRLHNLLEDEAEEQRFEASAIQAIKSDSVQNLFSKVAEKHAHYPVCNSRALVHPVRGEPVEP